jgi:hypothetical protein
LTVRRPRPAADPPACVRDCIDGQRRNPVKRPALGDVLPVGSEPEHASCPYTPPPRSHGACRTDLITGGIVTEISIIISSRVV